MTGKFSEHGPFGHLTEKTEFARFKVSSEGPDKVYLSIAQHEGAEVINLFDQHLTVNGATKLADMLMEAVRVCLTTYHGSSAGNYLRRD